MSEGRFDTVIGDAVAQADVVPGQQAAPGPALVLGHVRARLDSERSALNDGDDAASVHVSHSAHMNTTNG